MFVFRALRTKSQIVAVSSDRAVHEETAFAVLATCDQPADPRASTHFGNSSPSNVARIAGRRKLAVTRLDRPNQRAHICRAEIATGLHPGIEAMGARSIV